MTDTIEAWPSERLERVANCPICGHADRSLAHDRLTDVTFGIAKGSWTMWSCAGCGSGYLDPRPDVDSIGDAYGRYYTHDYPSFFGDARGDIRNRLGNGYRNWRFGLNLQPALRIGAIVATMLPTFRAKIDQCMRYLPRARDAIVPRILDFGCGNGAFLSVARDAGWQVSGVEPDSVARAHGIAQGMDIRSSLEDFARHENAFAVATLSHVIEHLHHPNEVLSQIASMLVPGGMIFIATPNMDAVGHTHFGRHWRGLEAPRHLMLFTRASLADTLAACGFTNIRFRAVPGSFEVLAEESRAIEAASEQARSDLAAKPPLASDDRAASVLGDRAELLVVTASIR